METANPRTIKKKQKDLKIEFQWKIPKYIQKKISNSKKRIGENFKIPPRDIVGFLWTCHPTNPIQTSLLS